MSDYQIVEFEPKHTSAVIGVVGRVLRDQNVIPESDEPVDDEDLQAIESVYVGRGRFWVALFGGQLIGTVAIFEVDQHVCKLSRMFVLKEHRGRGIGQRLFEHALAFAKLHGYDTVKLNTHVMMKRAHRFYERNGFERVLEEGESYHYQRTLSKQSV